MRPQMRTENEILLALKREAKKPSRNAATLTHNIGITFPFLETQWDDKARQIIGALVAVNASRMHTTIWAALFQQLRETKTPTVKVYILKQFANVCWTVPLTQGTNAFRAFALEIRPLLADIQIVTNTAFQKHFATIIRYLARFSEDSLSLELFNALYSDLVEWKRADALRAAANIIAQLVLHISYCPTVEVLLLRAKKDTELFGYVIMLETLVAADTSDNESQSSERLGFFCQQVNLVLDEILTSPPENSKSIPPFVSAYRRLKTVCPKWEPSGAPSFVAKIFQSLESDNASKLLICPYLQFLQTTSEDWFANCQTIWKHTENTDPFARADALAALSSKASALETSEKRIAIAELMEKLHRYIGESCSYTTTAILKFLRALALSPEIPLSTQQLYLTRVLHICIRFAKDFRDDAPAQLELLTLFASATALPEAAQKYVMKLFLVSSDRAVASKAFHTIILFSKTCKIDEETRTLYALDTMDSSFDGLFCADQLDKADAEPQHAFSFQRVETLTTLVHRRLLQSSLAGTGDAMSTIIFCDAVIKLCEFIQLGNLTHAGSQESTLTLLTHLLTSQDAVSSESYISLVQATSACVSLAEAGIRTNMNLFARLVQHAWSVLVTCASSLYSHYAPLTGFSEYRFFRIDATPYTIYELIVKCKDVALSNEVALHSSVFFEIMESNFSLLVKCASALSNSPLFLTETIRAINQILLCCETLFLCSPKHTLRLLTALLNVIVSFDSSGTKSDEKAKQHTFCFLQCCSSLTNRAFLLDFSAYCQELCEFLLFSLQEDKLTADSFFSGVIADNWNLIADLAHFCASECTSNCPPNNGATILAILRLLRCLCWSSYSEQISKAISPSTIDRIALFSEKWSWFPGRVECCHIVADIQQSFAQSSTKSVLFSFPSLSALPAATTFFEKLERVVDLWNVSDEATQGSIKQQLSAQHTGENLVILAALDNLCIPSAVEFVMTNVVEESILETLLLILQECSSDNLPPLELYVDYLIFGVGDALLKNIALSYRWGWVAGSNTTKMLAPNYSNLPNTDFCCLVRQLCKSPTVFSTIREKGVPHNAKDEKKDIYSPRQLFHGVFPSGADSFSFDNFSFYFSLEEILLSNTSVALSLLNQAFVKQDNFTDLSDPHIIFFFAGYVANVHPHQMFAWKLSEWISLLRSWVSVSLTTQPESDQWAYLQLSCWTLFYRVYNHLFSMAREGHRDYPKENGVSFFEELRRIYLQLSNLFLCCEAKSVDEVAFFTVRYALRNNVFFESGGICEAVFWCIARTCLEAVWVVISSERCASWQDPEVVKFLCRLQGKISLPLHIQRKAHTLLFPMLQQNRGASDDFELDAQRHALWLICSFGSRAYPLTSANERAKNSTVHRSSDGRLAAATCPTSAINSIGESETRDYCVFRAAVLCDLLKFVRGSLNIPAQASPSSVFDALEALCSVVQLCTTSSFSAAVGGATTDIEQAYLLVRDFLASISPLSADAPLQPATHCFLNLVGEFPYPRRAAAFSDEYALSLTTTILSGTLASWLRRRALLPVPPALIPCTLAVYLPYLMRLDLPLYETALQCVEGIAAYTASAEVEAVYCVVLPRLAEDLVDVRWSTQAAAGWVNALISLLGFVDASVQGGKEQISRRLWEGMWRGSSSPDVCHNQHVRERVQYALRRLICGLTPTSPQWELSRLVVLNASMHRAASGRGDGSAVLTAESGSTRLPLCIVSQLDRSGWRSLIVETQGIFALHTSKALDADNSRSLLFEFDKAVGSLLEPAENNVVGFEEVQSCCLWRERVTTSLLPSTDAILAALNYFDFSDWGRRRAVLHQLQAMIISEARQHPGSDVETAPWTAVYFDVLYERATCVDEGLWASCTIAAVEANKGQPDSIASALQSLIAASSTRWKRGFLLRAGQLAKHLETQGRVRDFFAGASDRLAASRVPLAVWKSELLVEVTFVFTAST